MRALNLIFKVHAIMFMVFICTIETEKSAIFSYTMLILNIICVVITQPKKKGYKE